MCGWGYIMGTTGTNVFLYEITLCLQYSHRLFVYLHSQYFHIWHIESPVVGFSPLFVYLNPQYFHIRHIWSAVVIRSASIYVRHCADATWWTIHHRPHVYKGFPYISLSTPSIFPYLTFLVARYKVFRLGICAALCGCKLTQTCNLVKDPPQTPCL